MSNIELYEYSLLKDNTCSIIGMSNNNVSILELPVLSPDGKTVTRIASRAFIGNKNITEVTIPESIKYIGDSCFENCVNLKKVTFPLELSEIESKAFKGCDLTSIIIPKTGYIDFEAFSENKNAIFYLSSSIGCIKSHAFNGSNKVLCSLNNKEQELWDEDWAAGVGIVEFVEEIDISLKENIPGLAETTKRVITSSKQDDTQSGIYYTKLKKISFSVKGLTFTDIPVLKSVQLSFYEKYTVLILQKGIKANDIAELVEHISNLLNISKKCIAELIEYLNDNDYLVYNHKMNMFKINPSINFTIDKHLDNAMFADIEIKSADCNNIVFVDELKEFYLDEDFSDDVFVRKGSISNKSNECLPSYISNSVYDSKALLEPLLIRSFSKTNMHLKNDFSYILQEDKFINYQLEFDALIEYKYFKEQKKALLQNVIVEKNNTLPEKFIKSLTAQYNIDTDLPKFIVLSENFYQKVNQCTDSFTEIENEINTVKNNIEPIKKQLNEKKAKLLALNKEHSREKKMCYIRVI